jgi:hypothetical protein
VRCSVKIIPNISCLLPTFHFAFRDVTRVARWFVFETKKSQFGSILEGLGLENIDIFNGRYEYFTGIWDIFYHFVHFMSFGTFYSGFGIMCQEKSGNPGRHQCAVSV